MEFIENEIDSGHHSGQPRVSFAESTSTQYHHLLASLNLLETQTMQAVASETHQEATDSFSSCDFDTRSGRWPLLGGLRLGGRNVDSRPRRFAVACCQTVPPKGVPNGALRRNAFNSASVSA